MPSTLSILITVFDDDERRKASSIWWMVATVGVVGGRSGAACSWTTSRGRRCS
jgi:hypothetical protein